MKNSRLKHASGLLIKKLLEPNHPFNEWGIAELQAVLSKIEGLSGKSKSFFEIDISLENPKIPEEQMEAFNIAMNMRTVFDQYNIDHSKLALFPDGVNDWEIVTGKIAGINVAYPRAK